MTDLNTQAFIESQDKAYYFQAKKHAESMASKVHEEVRQEINQAKTKAIESDATVLQRAKEYTDKLANEIKQGLSVAKASDNVIVSEETYPIGTMISVSQRSPNPNEDMLPYSVKGVPVNGVLSNIYVRLGLGEDNQMFYWFGGEELNNEHHVKLPGEWRSRGICGYFKSSGGIAYKFLLAQRTA